MPSLKPSLRGADGKADPLPDVLARMRPLRLLLLALLTALAAVPAADARAAVTIGIADQKADMFTDTRFAALGIRHARVLVPYDVLQDPDRLKLLDAWMAGAKASGVRPLITFDRSARRPRVNPTPARLASALKGLRTRYGTIREVATWNEANINKKPELVARWYLALRRACPTCTVLGADLLDRGNVGTWAKRFVKAAGRTPKVWGLHNYVDANRLSTAGTKKLLGAVRGTVWFTETGGVVKRNNGSSVAFPTSAAHAAKATTFLFAKLVRLSPRVQRVYVYHWNTGSEDARTWDSGLVGPDGNGRPALDVLAGVLRRTV